MNVTYNHNKRKYAIGYVNEEVLDSVIKQIKGIKHVKTVQESLLDYELYDIDFDVK